MAVLYPVRMACPACGGPMKALADEAVAGRLRYVCANCVGGPVARPDGPQMGGRPAAPSGEIGGQLFRSCVKQERRRPGLVDPSGQAQMLGPAWLRQAPLPQKGGATLMRPSVRSGSDIPAGTAVAPSN
jgi:hypothetical protein